MSVDYTDPNVWKQAQEQAGQHGHGAPVPSPPGTPPPNQRNVRRVLMAGCFGIVLLIAALIGAIGFFVLGSLRSSDAVKGAVERANRDPQVVAALGQPIEVGYFVSGTISVSGPGGSAELEVPVSGPKGKGTIYLSAVKRAGKWEYSILQVAIAGREDRIDLLQGDKVY